MYKASGVFFASKFVNLAAKDYFYTVYYRLYDSNPVHI